jgi:hypothetical protein
MNKRKSCCILLVAYIVITNAIIKLKQNDNNFLKKWVIVQEICTDIKCILHTNLQLVFQTYSDVNIWQKNPAKYFLTTHYRVYNKHQYKVNENKCEI